MTEAFLWVFLGAAFLLTFLGAVFLAAFLWVFLATLGALGAAIFFAGARAKEKRISFGLGGICTALTHYPSADH